jgi:DNA-directed RNA polymerase specialized sigma subunit
VQGLLKLAADGHWRRLKPGQVGEDQVGNDIYGKTWVDRKEKPKKVAPIKAPPVVHEKVFRTSKETRTKGQREIELWRDWKKEPTSEKLGGLLTVYANEVDKVLYKFRTAPVPPSAVEGAANLAIVKALNTYDPAKGAALRTYVIIHLKKVRAFVVKHQNLGRIPEHRAYGISEFKEAREELTQKLGHPPDAASLADHLGPKWSLAEVTRMEKELRPDLIESKALEPDLLPEIENAREREVLRYIYYELDPMERAVLEYSIGANGKPMISAGDIAKKLGISRPKVSRIRNKIDAKLRERGV